MKIIPLTLDDDIVSIVDHLHWAQDAQVVLVLPEAGGVLREGIDLVRLRRASDNLRVEVGLVTADVAITRQAKALGLPVFTTIGQARRNRAKWRRSRKARELVGLPPPGDDRFADFEPETLLDIADRAEAHRRLTPQSERRQWLWRYTAIFLFFMVWAMLVVAFLYLLPSATVVLMPEQQVVRVERPIMAAPEVTAVDFVNGVLPGRQLQVTQQWQSEVETSGELELPESAARGRVVFANLLAQEATIPAGTRVSTTDGTNRIYQTTAEALLPGVVGGTVEVDVIATEPGPQGNVDANLVNQVEGSLGLQAEVRNVEPIEGGTVRLTAAVTEADRERLRQQAVQFLLSVAASEMELQLTGDEFLTRDSVRIVRILDETYSHEVGEQANRLSLALRAEIAGTAVDTTAAADLAYEALGAQVPPGYTLAPDSIRFESGLISGVDEEGRVSFSMIANGRAVRNLAVQPLLDDVTGQPPDTAVAYLAQNLPLQGPPQVRVWPVWFQRMPYLSSRIYTQIESGE